MRNRRSIRKYKKHPILTEEILQVLEAGRLAPSGANQQPWIYLLVTDNAQKQQIRNEAELVEKNFHCKAPKSLKNWFKKQGITPQKSFLTEAPVLIVVAGYKKAPYWFESTWMSIAYILLQAASQGFGTLTYTPSDTRFLNKLLKIPDDYQPVAIIPIGYPAEKPSPETRPRKPLETIVHRNKYGSIPF
jgi:iodotyrosine deiodinase